MKRHGCQARQESDQMVCDRCGIRWDMNDPDPPPCQSARDKAMKKIKEALDDNRRVY